MTRTASLPEWARDFEAALPPMVPLNDAARAVYRHPRTLSRAAARGELEVLTGAGGRSIVPRASLVAWVANWARAGA